MKKILSLLKPYLRWFVLGGTLFFLAKALKDNWQQVAEIRIDGRGGICLAIALTVTIIAHLWSSVVWFSILKEFNQPVKISWAIPVYLKTNIAKYLPGNVWHFYGRISAATKAGISVEVAMLSVLLEPLLMVAAALTVASICYPQPSFAWQLLGLAVVLIGVHPKFLNPAIAFASSLKFKDKKSTEPVFALNKYPWRILLAEIIFVGIRGTGFLLTLTSVTTVSIEQINILFSAFCLAWVLGLIVPGSPGGVGVFEATAIALLKNNFSAGILLTAVAFYRLVSILAESLAAGVACLNKNAVAE
ncbi:MAG: UPF0104 family protein [Cyanobacteriota bacterium]|nr:UPF0104 family protein [Cyanobacteriota bacterium]